MHRRTRRRCWWLAVAWVSATLSGCLPLDNDPMRAAIGGTLSRPIDVQAVATLGPANPLPPSAYAVPRADKELPPKGTGPLHIPPELPGANEPPLKLPPLPKDAEGRDKVLRKFYPQIEPLGPEIQPRPGPDGAPLTNTVRHGIWVATGPRA